MISTPTLIEGKYRTPKGNAAVMLWREGTSDHNSIFSCMTEDEYGLKDLTLEGTALDVGAHLGGVTISLAVDNPNLRVIAVEALSENVELLRRNVFANAVSDRVTVIHAIAGLPGKAGRTGTVRWNFDANESGQHHRYIANAHLMEGGQSESADILSLDDVDGDIAFAKVDCEGCEYDFLRSKAIKNVREIRGEFHSGFERVYEMLNDTHVVTLTSGTEAFGGFRAVAR